MNARVRIIVVDDHPLYRDGVVRTLREMEGMEVVAECGSGTEAVALCARHRPDVALLDVSMPGGGIATVAEVLRVSPETKPLMLTVSESERDVFDALDAGAKGYVLKGVDGQELTRIIARVMAGDSHVEPALAANLLAALRHAPQSSEAGEFRTKELALNAREMGILRLLSKGRSNKEIARQLALQEKTIKHYLTVIFQKLNARNRVEAAMIARERLGIGSDQVSQEPERIKR